MNPRGADLVVCRTTASATQQICGVTLVTAGHVDVRRGEGGRDEEEEGEG